MSKRIEYYLSDRPSILIRPIELLSPDAQMNLATALLSLAKPKVIGIGQYQAIRDGRKSPSINHQPNIPTV